MSVTTPTFETEKSSILLKSENRLAEEKIKILKDLTSNFRDKTVTYTITGTDMLRAMRDGDSIDKYTSDDK